jgi:CHAT domain-containing protein
LLFWEVGIKQNRGMHMHKSIRYIVAILAITLGFSATLAHAQNQRDWSSLMLTGRTDRQQGRIELSIANLRLAESLAGNNQERLQAFTELATSLRHARRLVEAEQTLSASLPLAAGEQRARIEFELGNLATLRRDEALARTHYTLAQELAGTSSALSIGAKLNLLRALSVDEQLASLTLLFDQIAAGAQTQFDAHLYLKLGHQARLIGKPALPLAFRSLDRARALAAKSADSRLHLESLDELAQLYEQQIRHADALKLTLAALTQLRAHGNAATGDLHIAFEWRLARLYLALGQNDAALAAYQRAANQLELIRQDIPIDYDDGSSSFRSTFEPIYLGLIDMLLKKAANTSENAPAEQRELLLRAQVLLELMKQTELQDYLGDRCALDAVKGGSVTVIPSGTLILQPIIFSDRIELLVQTTSTITRFTTTIEDKQVLATAQKFADELREQKKSYLGSAQRLYDWLLRPLEGLIATNKIDTVVFVADAALRTMPLAALHDGKQYAIEKYAVANVTGLSMTNTSPPPTAAMSALVAGASSFGLVVEKYASLRSVESTGSSENASTKNAIATSSNGRMLRSVRANAKGRDFSSFATRAEQIDSLRAALALPGVTKEIHALQNILPGNTLLDTQFTLNAFTLAAQSAQYRIVHVASHGMFGGTASTSYILTYDDLLTLDGLQSMLKGEQFQKHPIELLSLSACETAAGSERAPLGISGAAMKARARSVLGTLWPVDDEAAVNIMEKFYAGLTKQRLSKAQALRQSQLELIKQAPLSHPFFWAPFALIGNWL